MVKEIIQEDAMYEDKFQVKQLHHIWCRPLEASKETYHMFLERFISWRQRTHQTSSNGFLNLRSRLNRMDWPGSAWGDWANYTASPLRGLWEMNSVCRLQWVFGTQQGFPAMAALRTSSAVVPQKSSMAEFRCLQPWDTSPQNLLGNSLASCLHLPALKFADVPNGLAAISKVPAAGWAQIAAYMAFCEVSQDQSPGTAAFAGDFGWKLITSDDPEVKKTKLNAELANGRLAMMAIIGMFFQARFSNWMEVMISVRAFDCHVFLHRPTGIYLLYVHE